MFLTGAWRWLVPISELPVVRERLQGVDADLRRAGAEAAVGGLEGVGDGDRVGHGSLLSSSGDQDLTALSAQLGCLPILAPPRPLPRARSPAWTSAATAFTDPVAQALVAELQQEFVVRYGGPDETPLDPTQFDPPARCVLRRRAPVDDVGRSPRGPGGCRPDVAALGGTVAAEIKRMYVVPRAQRRGSPG